MPVSRVGKLHDPITISRFAAITKDSVCLSILREGLKMEFVDYRKVKLAGRKNNKSARDGEVEVRKILTDWLQKEYIQECSREDLDCVLPLSLADRFIHSKQIVKFRLCLDAGGINR